MTQRDTCRVLTAHQCSGGILCGGRGLTGSLPAPCPAGLAPSSQDHKAQGRVFCAFTALTHAGKALPTPAPKEEEACSVFS